jgi:hypothetical protein
MRGPTVADPAPKIRDRLLAFASEVLRPDFRPRWWDFAITILIAAIAYPIVTRLFWLGKGATFEAASYYVLIFGLPTAVVVLNMYWRSPDARTKMRMRVLLQVAIMIVILVPLNQAGRKALRASIAQAQQNGRTALWEIRSFRKRYGSLPKSLAEIAPPDDDPLATPTFGEEFSYEVKGDEFILQLRLPTGKTLIYDSKRPRKLPDRGTRERAID